MRIQNNVMALNTHRSYTINNEHVSKSAEKLSSGYRINKAGDDAAGLAISEKMRSQIRGLNMATKNSQDAISLVQTAEGALQETHNILQRMRELSVQSASDTNETTVDRDALNKEFQQLILEIDDTAAKTKFNDMGLIDGTFSSNIKAAAVGKPAVYSGAWASTTTPDGVYDVKHHQVEVKAAVAGSDASITTAIVASDAKMTVNGTTVASDAISFSMATGNKDASLNGDWTLGFDSTKGLFTATNGKTGEVRTGAAKANNGTADSEIEFGTLGTLKYKGAKAFNAEDITGFSAKFTVSGGITEQKPVKEDYLSFNGEDVKLEAGQNVVTFEKNGVTLNLANTFAVGAADGSMTDKVTITSSSAKELVIQTGANKDDNLSISIDKMDAQTLGVKTANISNRLDASSAIGQVNKAVNMVSTQRAALGALQNRLDHKIANLKVTAENLTAAESRIRDVDIASEMTNFTKNNILSQAATAMLAQANSAPQNVLSLLR